MVAVNRLWWLIAPLVVAWGCSGGPGSGKLVPIKAADAVATDTDEPAAREPDAVANVPPAEKEPLAMSVKFPTGKSETYILTNDILTLTQTMDGQTNSEKSFLNAVQDVNVIVTPNNGPNVSIHTHDVRAGVPGDEPIQRIANDYIQKTAASIEGSVLHGKFDDKGRGTDLFFIGEGVGLNPLGPQASSQKLMVGFMGILLPDKAVKPGDTWTGTYDFTQSGMDLFENQGGRVENGKIPITYTLLDYDKENNSIRIGLKSAGKPVVKVPIEGAMATINMDVKADGQALVRLDDGWLQELRLETNVTTEGLVASKQTIKTVTRRKK
jgi:hypothetical protein